MSSVVLQVFMAVRGCLWLSQAGSLLQCVDVSLLWFFLRVERRLRAWELNSSPTLAGRVLPTAPPGKPQDCFLKGLTAHRLYSQKVGV